MDNTHGAHQDYFEYDNNTISYGTKDLEEHYCAALCHVLNNITITMVNTSWFKASEIHGCALLCPEEYNTGTDDDVGYHKAVKVLMAMPNLLNWTCSVTCSRWHRHQLVEAGLNIVCPQDMPFSSRGM